MSTAAELYYTKEHEWVREEGGKAYIGITDYAQSALGDIVFVELPEAGDEVNKGEEFAVVESVKTASDILSPVTGTIAEVNTALEDDPALVNGDPYGSYIAVVEMSDESELKVLMEESAYKAYLNEIEG